MPLVRITAFGRRRPRYLRGFSNRSTHALSDLRRGTWPHRRTYHSRSAAPARNGQPVTAAARARPSSRNGPARAVVGDHAREQAQSRSSSTTWRHCRVVTLGICSRNSSVEIDDRPERDRARRDAAAGCACRHERLDELDSCSPRSGHEDGDSVAASSDAAPPSAEGHRYRPLRCWSWRDRHHGPASRGGLHPTGS